MILVSPSNERPSCLFTNLTFALIDDPVSALVTCPVNVTIEQGVPWRKGSDPGSWQQKSWSALGESVFTCVFPQAQNGSV